MLTPIKKNELVYGILCNYENMSLVLDYLYHDDNNTEITHSLLMDTIGINIKAEIDHISTRKLVINLILTL